MKLFRNFFTICLCLILSTLMLLSPVHAFAQMNWQVNEGAGAGNGTIAVMKLYPSLITITEGDSITWSIQGDAHTVSFLSGLTPPSPLDPSAMAPAGANTYEGTGFVSSGLLFPGSTYTLTFTKAGTFTYQCLIHPGMMGIVVVQPKNTPVPHPQDFYTTNSRLQIVTDLYSGFQLLNNHTQPPPQTNGNTTNTYFISVGLGNATEAVMRFLPPAQVIHEGDTIVWTNNDPMDPHTVTFPGPNAETTESPDPVGSKIYDGSKVTSSGFILPGNTYSLTFTKSGVYNYFCILHDDLGMKGTVVVLGK